MSVSYTEKLQRAGVGSASERPAAFRGSKCPSGPEAEVAK
jgi:hypothetical protein